jgi:hypothetical protein
MAPPKMHAVLNAQNTLKADNGGILSHLIRKVNRKPFIGQRVTGRAGKDGDSITKEYGWLAWGERIHP